MKAENQRLHEMLQGGASREAFDIEQVDEEQPHIEMVGMC